LRHAEAMALELIESACWSFDVEEKAERGRKREGDNLDGDKSNRLANRLKNRRGFA
jgi:hypothetical protein